MKLAQVLGLDTRKQSEQGLINIAKLQEMMQAIADEESNVKLKSQTAWDDFHLALEKIRTELKTVKKKEFEKIAQQLRDLANQVSLVLKNKTIEFKQDERLKKVRMGDNPLAPRISVLTNRLKVFEDILGKPDDDQEPRYLKIKGRIDDLKIELGKVTTVEALVQCENDANNIFAFDAPAKDFDRSVLDKALSDDIDRVKPLLERKSKGYGYEIASDIAKAEENLQTIKDTNTSEMQTIMCCKLGQAICSGLELRVLNPDPKLLKIPHKVDTLTPAVNSLETVYKQLETFADTVSKAFDTNLEKEEFKLIVTPQLSELIESAKQILGPVVNVGKKALVEHAKLTGAIAPELERAANATFVRLKIAVTEAKQQASTNALLANWKDCEFNTKTDVDTQLKALEII